MVERQQASPCGAVMSSAEGKRGPDLDANAVGSDGCAIVLAVDDKASGLDRLEPFLARLHPVFGRELFECESVRGVGSGRETDQRPHGGLVRHLIEMDSNRPAAAAIVGRHHGFRGVEDLRQLVEQDPGSVRGAGVEPRNNRWTCRIWYVDDRRHLSTSFTGNSSHEPRHSATALSTVASRIFPSLSTALATVCQIGLHPGHARFWALATTVMPRTVRDLSPGYGGDKKGSETMASTGWRNQLRRIALAAVGAAALSGLVQPAAAYPDRPITVVVPFAPGGPTDIIARILSLSLGQSLGQQVVIDNRGGAAGNIGMGQVARATPDGHTLLLTSTAIAVNPALFKNLPYDPIKDFAPISELVNAPNVLVVHPDSGINTIADLVARAKAEPFNYASPGAGTKSHLTGELLKLRANIDMVHVPFRGAGPAAQAVLGKQTQLGSVALAAAEAMIQSGQLRALAVTSEKRWFSLPNVPTMIEAGYPGFVSDTFNALLAPAAVPAPILAVLVKETRAAFQKPEALAQARKAGFEIVAGAPEELAARIKTEIPAVRELVAKAGIPVQ